MPKDGGGKSFQIQDVELHPDYVQQAYQDIAVVKLTTPDSKLDNFFEWCLRIWRIFIFDSEIFAQDIPWWS